MRGHFAVGYSQGVGRREKGGGDSAWMARSSAPARRFRHASHEREGRRRMRKEEGTTKSKKDTKTAGHSPSGWK